MDTFCGRRKEIDDEARSTRVKGRPRMTDNIRHQREQVWFGGGRRPRQEKTEEGGTDSTEPRPGIIAGQGRRETAKTGELWRIMVQNPDWASYVDKGGGRRPRRRRMIQNPDLAS